MGVLYFEHICENGHLEVESEQLGATNRYCEKCGARVLNRCPNCGIDFGALPAFDGYPPEFEKPFYCKNCGNPFPWTERAIETARLIIEEDDQIGQQAKDLAVESLRDVISETPRTQIATVRLQKIMAAAGRFTADSIRQFVIDFGCELVRKQLGMI